MAHPNRRDLILSRLALLAASNVDDDIRVRQGLVSYSLPDALNLCMALNDLHSPRCGQSCP